MGLLEQLMLTVTHQTQTQLSALVRAMSFVVVWRVCECVCVCVHVWVCVCNKYTCNAAAWMPQYRILSFSHSWVRHLLCFVASNARKKEKHITYTQCFPVNGMVQQMELCFASSSSTLKLACLLWRYDKFLGHCTPPPSRPCAKG